MKNYTVTIVLNGDLEGFESRDEAVERAKEIGLGLEQLARDLDLAYAMIFDVEVEEA